MRSIETTNRGNSRRRGDERNEHQPVEQQIAPERREQRPRVGGHHADTRCEEVAVFAKVLHRWRLGRQLLARRMLELLVHLVGARVMHPRREPTAGVSAAGDGGQIVELAQQAKVREAANDADREGRAANAAAGQAERRRVVTPHRT